MNQLSFVCYESVEAVATLEDEWRQLHGDCTCCSVFNGFDFFMASVTACPDPESHLYVLKASNRDGLVAIFPFQLSLLEIGGARLRLLEYAAQDEIDKPYPLIRRDCETRAWQGLAAYLAENRKRWHRLDLVEVRDGFPAISQLSRCFHLPAYWVRTKEDQASPLVSLDRPWEDFWQAHPKMRKKVKRMQKAFGERLRFQVQDRADTWRACLDSYLELESRGWKAGRTGIGKDEKTLALYRALFSSLASRGKLSFGILYLDEEPIAAEIACIEGKSVYFCHGTYNERYARYSPGMVSTCLFLRHFHGGHFDEGDYLAGFASYLHPWADRILSSRMLTVYRISALVLYAFAVKVLRRLRSPRQHPGPTGQSRHRTPSP